MFEKCKFLNYWEPLSFGMLVISQKPSAILFVKRKLKSLKPMLDERRKIKEY